MVEGDSACNVGENDSADEDEKLAELQGFCANILLFIVAVTITGLVI